MSEPLHFSDTSPPQVITGEKPKTKCENGFLRETAGISYLYVTKTAFVKLFEVSLAVDKLVLRVLRKEGILISGSDTGYTQKVEQKGIEGRQYYLVFDYEKLLEKGPDLFRKYQPDTE